MPTELLPSSWETGCIDFVELARHRTCMGFCVRKVHFYFMDHKRLFLSQFGSMSLFHQIIASKLTVVSCIMHIQRSCRLSVRIHVHPTKLKAQID
jgi:hypothetical protein